jgi:NAD(P)-dependent dehydrogenase (short-subunit alcohol dehydrogenase family)
MKAGFPSGSSHDKVTVITGGTRGIGEACARLFVQAGAAVVICARGSHAGEALAAELTAKGPGTCHFERCDVAKPDDIKRLIDTTIELHGRLDSLINNAGQHPDHRPIDDFSIEELEGLLRLNLVSYFAACKYALPHLRKTRGSIINMSSLVGSMAQEWATTYAATKGGISALTKALAIDEARHGVRVNAILPGRIATPAYYEFVEAQDDPQDAIDYNERMQWLGRLGEPMEVASACLFLSSDGASFITGIELLVTGGAELACGIKQPGRYLVSPGLPEGRGRGGASVR